MVLVKKVINIMQNPKNRLQPINIFIKSYYRINYKAIWIVEILVEMFKIHYFPHDTSD